MHIILAFLFAAFELSIASAAVIGQFDFVIVGGGTAGLTIANRLSELSNITVAVIEAGGEVLNNPNVTNPNLFLAAIGTPIDWDYTSTNQTSAGGRQISLNAGKALGGTSTINGMTYVRGDKEQVDAWGTIGNKGWSWDDLFPYYKKYEDFEVPTVAQDAAGASYDPSDHGESGPLKTGYPYDLQNGTLHQSWESAWSSLGIPPIVDANGGQVRGSLLWQSTLDRDANVREDAARAFYYPVRSRSNLYVFLGTTANKLVWSSCPGQSVAEGVIVTAANGTMSTIKARQEVILSAGSLRSPAILEHSGVGNPSILSSLNITTRINLPGVGENLIDQPNNNLIYNSTNIYNGTSSSVVFGTPADFNMTLPSDEDLSTWAELVSAANNYAINASSLEYLFKVQSDLLQNVTNAETIFATTHSYGVAVSSVLSSAFWVLMPFARGNVHISSTDPLAYPNINPNYFLVDYDLQTQAAIAKWTRKFWQTPEMSSLAAEISPGYDVLPLNATDEQFAEWTKTSFSSNSHYLGTAAMMPQKLGGVVDSSLKVYGTSNVRVVDASIMPFQISGHLTATIYAVAEKAADIIKRDIL